MTDLQAPTEPSPGRHRRAWSRVAATTSIAVSMLTVSIVLAGTASAQEPTPPVPAPSSTNPLDGITPSLSFLGPAFNNVWARVIASIWAVLLGATAVKLMVAIYKMRAAKAGGYAAEMTDAMGEAKVSGIAFACLSAVTVIIGAIIFVTN